MDAGSGLTFDPLIAQRKAAPAAAAAAAAAATAARFTAARFGVNISAARKGLHDRVSIAHAQS